MKDGFLINPTVVDARTGITTQLLSEEGFTVDPALNPTAEEEASYGETDFELKFFAEATNMLFCKTFLENALRDPISGEIGKSIVFESNRADPNPLRRPVRCPHGPGRGQRSGPGWNGW